MGLTCECSTDGDWYYTDVEDIILKTNKRKRCTSCNTLIELNTIAVKFYCYRNPITEVEEKIYGEDGEIEIASQYMCESCGDLYWSLDELGFCINLNENMKDLVEEYAELYGKQSAN